MASSVTENCFHHSSFFLFLLELEGEMFCLWFDNCWTRPWYNTMSCWNIAVPILSKVIRRQFYIILTGHVTVLNHANASRSAVFFSACSNYWLIHHPPILCIQLILTDERGCEYESRTSKQKILWKCRSSFWFHPAQKGETKEPRTRQGRNQNPPMTLYSTQWNSQRCFVFQIEYANKYCSENLMWLRNPSLMVS